MSDDLTQTATFEVSATGVAIDCDDYNGVDVSFVNPEQGPLRSPYLTGSLAACKASSNLKAPKWAPQPYYMPYYLSPDSHGSGK